MPPKKGSKRNPITGKYELPLDTQEGTKPEEEAMNFNEFGEIFSPVVTEEDKTETQFDQPQAVKTGKDNSLPAEYAGMSDRDLNALLNSTIPSYTRFLVTRDQLIMATVSRGYCVVHHRADDHLLTMHSGCHKDFSDQGGRSVVYVGQDITNLPKIRQEEVAVILHFLVADSSPGKPYVRVLIFKPTGEIQEMVSRGYHSEWVRDKSSA